MHPLLSGHNRTSYVRIVPRSRELHQIISTQNLQTSHQSSQHKASTTHTSKMTQPFTHQARSAYRALLREIPRANRSTPSPLHQRLRAIFRSQEQSPSTPSAPTPSHASSNASFTQPSVFSIPSSPEEHALRLQEAEQLAQYAKAQRTYAELLLRYNPGMDMEEEERIRLTARRVGFDLPELHNPEEGKGQKE